MPYLVLSRKRDQKTVLLVPASDRTTLIVGNVIDIRGDHVRLGWKANRRVQIYRRELLEHGVDRRLFREQLKRCGQFNRQSRGVGTSASAQSQIANRKSEQAVLS